MATYVLPTSSPYVSRTLTPEPIIRRDDPIVYGKAEDGPLGKSKIKEYSANGFIVLKNLLPEFLIGQVQQESDRLYSYALHSLSEVMAPGEVVLEPGNKAIRSIFNIHKRYAFFNLLSQNQLLLDIVRQLLNDELYIHQSRISYKPAFEGRDFSWHSDFETWHMEDGMPKPRAISCSILLTENFAYNGPQMVISGSHKYFVPCQGKTPQDHFKTSLKKQVYGVPSPEAISYLCERGHIRALKGKPGDVVFFDCNIMHGSSNNISPNSRNNIFFVYNSINNQLRQPYGGTLPRPEYIASREPMAF